MGKKAKDCFMDGKKLLEEMKNAEPFMVIGGAMRGGKQAEMQKLQRGDRMEYKGALEMKDTLLMDVDGHDEFVKAIAKWCDKELMKKVEAGEMHIKLQNAAEEIHRNAVAHGWWEEKRSDAEVRALIHSEWSEALEEARAGRPMEWYACKHGDRTCDPDLNCPLNVYRVEECPMRIAKPEGIAVELIDGVIRILDWFGKQGYQFDKERNPHVLGAKKLCNEFSEHKYDLSKIPVAEIVDLLHGETAQESWAEGMGYENCIGIVFAWLDACGVNPEAVMLRKHEYNVTRPYKHGKKF